MASGTVNTDFAETEVDTRRTNLTRFPLFFPEKRTFFLEGDDIFGFGLGLEQDVLPYFSRRIGLVGGQEVPIIAGGKINGRIGETNFGGLVVGTNDKTGVVEDEALMAVGRVKRNLWRESWVGGIATVGDPLGRPGSWLAGADFTYATSHFRGDKNFLVGVWGLATGREDLGHDATAHGFKIDYPNDLWDIAITYKRIGTRFRSVARVRPSASGLSVQRGRRQQSTPGAGTDTADVLRVRTVARDGSDGRWESYRVFCAPDQLAVPERRSRRVQREPDRRATGRAVRVVDGVTIAPGAYHWRQYRLEAGTAQKRRFYTQLTWWFGGFYDGELDQFEWTGAWNPVPLVTVEFTGERDIGRLPSGNFTQTLVGNRLRLNISPDLSIVELRAVRHETATRSARTRGSAGRSVQPAICSSSTTTTCARSLDRWQLDSNQLLVKVQYAFRY